MSTAKIGEKTINISKLLFFTIKLHFLTSNLISTYRKLNLPLTSSIYFIFLPPEIQIRLRQTKEYHVFSYFDWKETTHNLLKVTAAKSLFSSVYVVGTTCFDECFSFYVITKRHYFSFRESSSWIWYFFKRHFVTFFEASVLKEVRILRVISTITTWC